MTNQSKFRSCPGFLVPVQVRRRWTASIRFLVVSGIFLFSTASALVGQSKAASTPIRILFIGNSYTYFNDLPKTLQSIASAGASPRRLELGTILIGGATLRSHWNDSTLHLIRRGRWDYVVLQEQSVAPIQSPEDFMKYGKRFAQAIRAAGARPVLFMTWARKDRPASQDSLTRSYLTLGRQINALIVPVGPTWAAFQRLDTKLNLYAGDGSHPSSLGSLLAACVFYQALFGEALPVSYSLPGVSPRSLSLMRQAVEMTAGRFQLQ